MSNTVEFKIKFSNIGGDNVKNITAQLVGVDDIVTQITQNVRQAGETMSKAAAKAFEWNQVRDLLSGVVDIFEKVTAPAQQFNQAMREANTMANLGEKEFSKLKSSIHELSVEIPVARDLLAKGLYQTISNGVPEDNWVTFLEKSARSSVGGLANLEKVVTVTSTVIKNYGLSWDAAGAIQDKIQNTAKNGVTSFEQLAEALPRVSGSAATLGVSIDDLLASFATLTGVSGNTAEVSTQLAAIMNALIKPTSEATKMAQAMGVEFNAAAIKAAGGMIPFLQNLDGAIANHSDRTGMLREEIYGLLFSSAEALRAILPLTGELGSKWVDNSEIMAHSAGAMDAAFAQMEGTGDAVSQKLKNWASGFSDLASSIMGASMPIITFIAQGGIAFTQMTALYNVIRAISFKEFISGVISSKAALLVKSAALAVASFATKAYGVAIKGLTMILHSAKLAAVAFWGAITLGVGLLIWGVIEMIISLTGSVEQNSEAMTDAQQAQKSYDDALIDVRGQLKLTIAELANFNGTKAEEARKVAELNGKYGDAFGTYKSVADWYDTLVGKSEVYCKMIANEAKIRAIANQVAISEQKADSIMTDAGMAGVGAIPRDKNGWVDMTKVTPDQFKAYKEATPYIEEANAGLSKMGDILKENTTFQKQLGAPVKKKDGTGGVGEDTTLGLLGKIGIRLTELRKLRDDATSPTQVAALNGEIKKLEAEQKRLNNLTVEQLRIRKQAESTTVTSDLSTIPVDKIKVKKPDSPIIGGQPSQLETTLTLRLKGVERAESEISRLRELLGVAQTPQEAELINTQIASWQHYTGAMKDNMITGEKTQMAIGGIGQVMGNLSNVVGEGAGAWLGYAGNVLQAVAQMMPALLASALGGATASAMGLPAPANFIMLGISLASVAAAFASIPKFADGGIAYGPTMGIFGEYSGAANNPEVVAPLNKLRNLIQPQGGIGGEVRFEIDGRKLVGILNKMSHVNTRTNG